MEQKDRYTLRELFDNLEITMTELSQISKISDVTLGRVYKGHSVRRNTINILLRTFSEIYGLKFSQKNVDGIIIQGKPVSVTGQEVTIPSDLPQGTVKLVDFVTQHNLPDSSVGRWIENGLKGERIETEARIGRNGRPQHYLTPAQQEKALDLLRRHGKLKTEELA